MTQELGVECPYCGESFETIVDESAGSQDYVEDCPVCCRPIEYRLQVPSNGEAINLTAHRDDE